GDYFYKPVLSDKSIFPDTLHHLNGVKLVPYMRIVFEQLPKLGSDGYITPLMLNVTSSFPYIVCEYSQDNERMLYIYDRITTKGYNLSGGVLDQNNVPVVLRPLDLINKKFYYIKKEEYESGSKEESNPIIGIVELND